ncbi:hypothetical protein [Pararhizobium gei]|uniref:hypothetical protein n=1 Tax=Pararhizobium gei TaxID=1395951 RepID=UPI0023D9EF0B|nr:hypothetical protein [Rhizobium gei]
MTEPTFTTPWDNDPLMLPAFVGCVSWALGNDEIVARYKMETGDTLFGIPGAGEPAHFVQRFSDWVAENIFGTPDDVYSDGKKGAVH